MNIRTAVLVAFVWAASYQSPVLASDGYVLGARQQYVRVDSETYRIEQVESLLAPEEQYHDFRTRHPELKQMLILDGVTDPGGRREFLSIGRPQGGYLHGYLVLRSDDLAPLAELAFGERGVASSILLPSPSGDLVFVTTSNDLTKKASTTVYDGRTYRELRRVDASRLNLGLASCFLENGELFASGRVFDPTGTKVIRETNFVKQMRAEASLPTGCQNGVVLLLAKTPEANARLILLNASSAKVMSRMDTQSHIDGFSHSEWRLWKGATWVVRDVERAQNGASVRPGVLEVFDATGGSKRGEVKLPLTGVALGVMGGSPDGRLLFYGQDSQNKLFVVDLEALSVRAEIALPFSPKAVVWN